MRTKTFHAVGLAMLMALVAPLGAAAQNADPSQSPMARQMLTEEERNIYRERLQNAESTQERQQIQNEYHTIIQDRAHQRGTTMSGGQGKGSSSWGTKGGASGSGRSGGGGGQGGGGKGGGR